MKLIQIGSNVWVAVDQICAVYATKNELRVLDRMGTWHLASAGSLEEAKERAALLVRQVNKSIDNTPPHGVTSQQ